MSVLSTNTQPTTAQAMQPWQAPIKKDIVQRAEQRVIKQLLQALLFEDIIKFTTQTAAVSVSHSDLLDFVIPTTAGVEYRAQGQVQHSFGIIRFNDKTVQRRTSDGSIHTATLEQVIADIVLPLNDAALKDSFINELRHTLTNEIQAQTLALTSLPPIDELSYSALEGVLMHGHPYHPCFKSRLGFDIEDNYAYAPEFANPIEVLWLAVDKALIASNTLAGIEISEWVADYVGESAHQKLQKILSDRLEDSNKSATDYTLVPVHPWQWQQTLIEALQPLLVTQDIIYLGGTGETYRAQQSIRSLTADKDGKPYLKLSMHLVNTSSTRILAKHTVLNAAIMTAWLKRLAAEDDSRDAAQIAFLGENVGVSLDHDVLRARGYQHPALYGGLAAIWRDNADDYLAKGQQAIPLNGVSYVHSDGQALIAPWLEAHGVAAWTEALIAVTVPPIMHLLFGHGLALECHAQNIVLVHEDGYPVKVLLKDLHDGVRYSPKHLTRQDLIPKFHQLPAAHAALNRGSFIETDDTDGIRDMTVACLFFVAFADIAIFLQREYQYAETDFWQQVADCIYDYQARHPEFAEQFARFDVFAPQTRIESLAKRRLFGDSVFPIKYINNPLANCRVPESC